MPIDEMNRIGIPHENGWVTGNLVKNGERPMIVDDILEEIEESIYPTWWVVVDSDSVGQYTGLTDKNGCEICEGDVLLQAQHVSYYIKFIKGCYYAVSVNKVQRINWDPVLLKDMYLDNRKIIGNIYDDKHLLESGS